MVLYELLMITRCNLRAAQSDYQGFAADRLAIKSLLTFCAKHVLNNKGVVRQFENLGSKPLPYRMKRHQEIFDNGSYFTMKFDSNPQSMQNLDKALKLNESVIRHSFLKLGSRLREISDYVPPEKIKK
jgi:small subunit ribosomal protein S6